VHPAPLAEAIARTLAQWTAEQRVARLWNKDASLWTSSGEEQWLGWLDVIEAQRAELPARAALAAGMRQEGITDVLLLGMGGSSLGPEVVARVIAPDGPRLHVLDSTDQAQVKRFDDAVDLSKTLVLVASKSGSTLEPNVFLAYFFERLKQVVGEANAGRHVVAITDPGSQMQKVAERDGFRAIVFGDPTVGGRFSVLSAFGTVPAALIGVIIGEWFGSPRGLGVLVINAMQNFQIPLLWSAVVLAVVSSLTLYGIFGLLQRAAQERFR